ncbi:hypothetical protein GCM10010405_51150 [Streptomyces macrosporus]|uniref:Carrier domain-containing protein n=1 Tax=Streptomyces macrosporus TaxID=44032 RepID=A0ABN3KI22_9ACTN
MTSQGALLTQQQQAIWAAQQLHPSSNQYNVPVAYRLSGAVDTGALDRALVEILRTHPVLRTSVGESETGLPFQTINPSPESVLRVRRTEADRLLDILTDEASEPFGGDTSCRLRARLFVTGDDEATLLLVFDHLAVDAPSVHLVLRQLEAAYGAFAAGATPEPPAKDADYFHYASSQHEWFQSESGRQDAEYWGEYVRDLDPEPLLPRSARGGRGEFAPTAFVPVEIPSGLLRVAGELHITPFSVLMASLSLTMRNLYRSRDVLIAYPVVDWRRSEYEGVVGLFTQMLLFRSPAVRGRSLLSYARDVQEALAEGLDHQGASLDLMWARLRENRTVGADIPVMLSLNEAEGEVLRLPGIGAEQIPVAPRSAKADLLLSVNLHGDHATGRLDFRTDLYDAPTAERIATAFSRALARIVAGADGAAEDVDLVSEADRHKLLERFARGETWEDEVPLWLESFSERAAGSPDAVALIEGDTEITYGELDRRSRALATRIARCRLPAGSPVAVCLPRSARFVVAVVAVLRQGLAFLPVDLEQPVRRRSLILADAGAVAAVVDGEEAAGGLSRKVRPVVYDDTDVDADTENAADAEITRNSPAYLITTSGSTGLPKTVVVPHGAIANNLAWKRREFGFGARDRFYFKTPPVFDASVWEYLGPLSVGASVVVAPAGAHRDPRLLLEEMRRHGVTVVQFVPTLLKMVLAEDAGLGSCTGLRWLFCGGEQLDQAVVRAVQSSCEARVVNLYGPTEAAIDATFHLCASADGEGGAVPIGRPIRGADVHVLGRGGQLLPPGFVGELHIGGAPLATGYANRDKLTAERFVPHPYAGDASARLYRTGDLVRFREDGTLEFVGRDDAQAKVRGLRVDLDGIRSLLCEHPRVADAAVVVRPEAADSLVAYVVSREGVDTREVRAHLAARLPAELVPSHVVAVGELPLTPSGKVDLRALPEPQGGEAVSGGSAPRTALERRLTRLWAELLQVPDERVPRNVSFFELGGNSLTLIRLHRRLRAEFPGDIQVTDLFKYPTVAAVADFLGSDERHG